MMAALPPDTIQVKRKRGIDDAPVDFLRVDGNKRYRISSSSTDVGWVYQRRVIKIEHPENEAKPATPDGLPVIQTTAEEDNKKSLSRPKKAVKSKSLNASTTLIPGPVPASIPAAEDSPEETHPTVNLRKFHLSKPNSSIPAAGVSKKRGAPAVFVERGPKRQRSAILSPQTVEDALAPPPQSDNNEPTRPSSSAVHEQLTSAQYKRPGRRPPASTSAATSSKPTIPLSGNERDLTQLAQIMDSWTLNEINKNLDRMTEMNSTSKSSPASSRFKPKAPKLRYHERPEALAEKERAAANEEVEASTMDIDSDGTDDDYVLETYERVPAQRLRDQAVPAHRVGLLVFDNEPDMVDFFYGNEDETDDEFPEDEDDENAENYYAHEYPDEDLEWDDEFDQHAYHYMNQNASDNEEWDERDFEDDVWERSDRQNNPFLPG